MPNTYTLWTPPCVWKNYRFAMDETFLRGSAAQLVSWRLALVVVLFAGGLILYSKRIARLAADRPRAGNLAGNRQRRRLLAAGLQTRPIGGGQARLVMMFTRVAKHDAVIPTASVNTDLFLSARHQNRRAPSLPGQRRPKMS